jgi:hypothetical protein
MPTVPLLHDAKHWRDRAQEARAQAEQMSDPQAKSDMLGIADGYERLAMRAEERLASSVRPKDS